MDDEDIIEKIKRRLKERGWSMKKLAKEAKISPATLHRMINQRKYTDKTLEKVCKALGITDKSKIDKNTSADIKYGGYHRIQYHHYEDTYLCLRYSFKNPKKYMLYEMDIRWCDEKHCLVFEDKNPGFQQKGELNLCAGTPFIHFMTHDKGAVRVITTYHMTDRESVIRGLLMTLTRNEETGMHPGVTPIVIGKKELCPKVTESLYGLIDMSHESIRKLSEYLKAMNAAPLLLALDKN